MQKGDTVTYLSYGAEKSGIISHFSRDGSIVFLTNGKWLHRDSILTVNGVSQ